MALSRLTSSWSTSISGFFNISMMLFKLNIFYRLHFAIVNGAFYKSIKQWFINKFGCRIPESSGNWYHCIISRDVRIFSPTIVVLLVSSYNPHLPSGRQMLINIDSTSTSHICQLLVTEWTPLITSQWPLSLPFNQDRTRTLELISWLYGEFKL